MAEDYTEITLGFVKGSSSWYKIKQFGPEGTPICPCTGFKYRQKCRHIDDYKKGNYSVEMQFRITFSGNGAITIVDGETLLNGDDLTIEEATDKLLRTEAFLEKLTGLKVSIEQVL